jgi:hypothetical protein
MPMATSPAMTWKAYQPFLLTIPVRDASRD